MSKQRICLTIIVYFLTCFAFALYLELRKPFEYLHAISIARAFGGSVFLFLASSIIPIIVWAFLKFRIERAKVVLIIWAMCGVLIGLIQKYEADYQLKISHAAPASGEKQPTVSPPAPAPVAGVPYRDRLAADQGDASAQITLGLRYDDGRGVPQDYVLAHMWLSLASAGGNADAQKHRSIIASKMTPAQISEAQRLAYAWKPK